MIARHWKGIVKPGKEDAYLGHLANQTFPEFRKIKGFIRSSVLRRTVADGTEFLVMTNWDSLDSIGIFAGEDINKAVIPDIAQQMMVRFDKEVLLYEFALEFDPDK